jgi:hypothetical protein
MITNGPPQVGGQLGELLHDHEESLRISGSMIANFCMITRGPGGVIGARLLEWPAQPLP